MIRFVHYLVLKVKKCKLANLNVPGGLIIVYHITDPLEQEDLRLTV